MRASLQSTSTSCRILLLTASLHAPCQGEACYLQTGCTKAGKQGASSASCRSPLILHGSMTFWGVPLLWQSPKCAMLRRIGWEKSVGGHLWKPWSPELARRRSTFSVREMLCLAGNATKGAVRVVGGQLQGTLM